jgi:uracil-DNA glycosylase
LFDAANSHKDFGWQQFTDAIIETINKHAPHVVFLLWGAQAHAKGAKINEVKHLVLKSPHPSGLSANRATPQYPGGFFQNGHFRKTNEFLTSKGLPIINWKL